MRLSICMLYYVNSILSWFRKIISLDWEMWKKLPFAKCSYLFKSFVTPPKKPLRKGMYENWHANTHGEDEGRSWESFVQIQ